MESMTIGQLAERAGVGIETVRFYERSGLIEEPPRRASGYRQFPEESVGRLQFIRRAKSLGFSLKEVRQLLEVRVDSSCPCTEVEQRLEAKLVEIDAKIRDLRAMKQALVELASSCKQQPSPSDCPVLESWSEVRKASKLVASRKTSAITPAARP